GNLNAGIRHHEAELARCREFYRRNSEESTERPIEIGGTSAALQVAEHHGSSFFPRPLFQFTGDLCADTTKAGFAIRWLIALGDVRRTVGASALGRDHAREMAALCLATRDLPTDALVRERNLGNQDDVRATRQSGVDRDPAGIPAH